MPRGINSEFDPRRRPLGRPRPTPYFQLGDSAQQVASDWATGPESHLYQYSRSGTPSADAMKEVDFNLSRGDTNPREKERLTNLRKAIQRDLEDNE